MRVARPTILLRRIVSAGLVGALLLLAVPAYAVTGGTSGGVSKPGTTDPTPKRITTTTTKTTTTKTTTTTPKTTTKTTTKKTTTTKSSTTSTRQPATGTSAVTTPVDPNTEAFRKRLAEQQAKLDAFMAQLDKLDEDLAIATDEYNNAAEQLDEMKQRVKVAEGDLATAEKSYNKQAGLLREQARTIYRNGSMATIDLLLASKSVSDFMTRAKFLNDMGLHQADVLASLRAQRDLIEQQLTGLAEAKKQAEALEFEMKARRIEIMLRIQDRQKMLASAKSDLVALLQQEAARREKEQQALLYGVVSGTNALGIDVVAGAPVETALAYHGIPYVWAGESPSGFDCSGLLKYVFAQHGVKLPHYALSQFMMGQRVGVSELQPGDAVFFGSPVHHCGIYIGGGYFIHAPRTGDYVKISRLADRHDYAGASRYAWVPRTAPPLGGVTTTTQALSAGWR